MTTFVDTNVLVYAHDAGSPKQVSARMALERLWTDRSGSMSTQILQEFYAVATKPHTLAMSHGDAREIVGLYSAWPIVLIEPVLIVSASRLAEQRRMSIWDALVVEAAKVAGADRLLTEDFQDGQQIEGIRVVNPFRADTFPA